jgi:hypothetical protein
VVVVVVVVVLVLVVVEVDVISVVVLVIVVEVSVVVVTIIRVVESAWLVGAVGNGLSVMIVFCSPLKILVEISSTVK